MKKKIIFSFLLCSAAFYAFSAYGAFILCGKGSFPPIAQYDWFCLEVPDDGSPRTWQSGGLREPHNVPEDLSVDLCGAAEIGADKFDDPLCWKIDAVLPFPPTAIDGNGQICAPLNMPGIGRWNWFCYDTKNRTWRAGGFVSQQN